MKKILFFGMMAALLLGTASCSSDMEPSMGDDMVRFTIELPGNIDSRAISVEGKTNNNNTDVDAEFVGCKFISNTETTTANPTPASMYAVWISGGTSSFNNCEFTGYRGIKIHEAYGSDVNAVYIDGCNFHDLAKKPGLAIGTLNAPTIVSIKNSTFKNCQPGDQGLYMYETTTPVTNFNFIDENNTIINE